MYSAFLETDFFGDRAQSDIDDRPEWERRLAEDPPSYPVSNNGDNDN